MLCKQLNVLLSNEMRKCIRSCFQIVETTFLSFFNPFVCISVSVRIYFCSNIIILNHTFCNNIIIQYIKYLCFTNILSYTILICIYSRVCSLIPTINSSAISTSINMTISLMLSILTLSSYLCIISKGVLCLTFKEVFYKKSNSFTISYNFTVLINFRIDN